MADCERLEGCSFFNDRMKNMPLAADILKKQYCKGDNSACARYYIYEFVEGKNYDLDASTQAKVAGFLSSLSPNDLTRAKKMFPED